MPYNQSLTHTTNSNVLFAKEDNLNNKFCLLYLQTGNDYISSLFEICCIVRFQKLNQDKKQNNR